MLIKYGEHSLDLDTIHGPSDLMDFINSIQPQDKCYGYDRTTKPKDNELLFDECTSKEMALRNLTHSLALEEVAMKKRLLPREACDLYRLKQRTTVGEITLPPVEYEDYLNVQKVSYIKAFVESYLSMLIQSRIGFGLHARVDEEGKIYILRDLRDLYQFG